MLRETSSPYPRAVWGGPFFLNTVNLLILFIKGDGVAHGRAIGLSHGISHKNQMLGEGDESPPLYPPNARARGLGGPRPALGAKFFLPENEHETS